MGAAARTETHSTLIAWRPQPGPQVALLTCPVRDVLFGGARGGGKTDGLLGKFAQRATVYPRHARGLFIRRSYDELDEAVARSMEIYPSLGGTWRASRRTWYFPLGARLKMRSLERDADASKYQGHGYSDVLVDEGGNFPDPAPLDKLRATIRSAYGVPGFFGMSANPGGPGHAWINQRYIEPAPTGMVPFPDPITGELRVFIPSRLEDNQILVTNDPGYRLRIMQSGPPWLVQAWLNGDWNATPEGGLIKSEWFRRYTQAPAEFIRLVQSWDTAYKPDQHNDYSVCTTWAQTRTGYYLLDVWRKKVTFPELQAEAVRQFNAWPVKPHAVLVEDKGSGISLVQQLRATTSLPVIALDPEGQNKVDRAVAVSSLFQAGLVHFPVSAAWLQQYEIELTIFPLAAHDDQVDSTSQALQWMHSYAGRIEYSASGNRRAGLEGEAQQDTDRTGRLRGRNDFRGY